MGNTTKRHNKLSGKENIASCNRDWNNKEITQNHGAFDVVIKCEAHKFHAHKQLLSRHSDYFKAMFSSNMREQHQLVINLEITEAQMEIIMDFIYNSKLAVTSDNISDVISVSEYFQIPHIRNNCISYFKENVNLNNSLHLFHLYNFYNLIHEVMNTSNYICEHFEPVIKQEDSKSLSKDDIESLLALPNKVVFSEKNLYDLIINWVKHKTEERQQHFSQLLSHLNLNKLPTTVLKEMLLNEHLVQNNTYIKEVVEGLIKSRMNKDGSDYSDILVITSNRMTKYDTLCKKWLHIPPAYRLLISSRSSATAIKLENKLYVMGGYKQHRKIQTKNVLTSVESLDLNDQLSTWKEVADMKKRRCAHASAVLNGRVYVSGGLAVYKQQTTYEVFDPKQNRWCLLQQMKEGRMHHAMISYNGLLYSVGGVNQHTECLQTVECCDPISGKILLISPMKERRSLLALVVLNDEMYAIGGTNNTEGYLSTVEKYNFSSNLWSYITSLPKFQYGGKACVVNGRMYVFGGRNADNTFTNIVYDPIEGQWEEIECLNNNFIVGAVPV
ncbi:kelch-like protein 12 [Clavelina lepadiformis]|uniref:kelch-like protein 12 n=1 Tax=Clavelina lepadiformis TaxID=159417 RepID=UPI0040439172